MRKSIFTTAIVTVLTLTANFSFAQDAEDCKDHTLVNRMPGFYLYKCEEAFAEFDILIGIEKTKLVEGMVYNYEYYINDGAKVPSRLQVLKNYENAILQNNGETVYFKSKESGEGLSGATFRMKSGNDIYWLTFTYFNGSEFQCDGYHMSVIRVEGMKQEITANEMFEKVNSGNSLSLYINFDTGKSTIKSESQNIIDELYTMLKDNPTLKITIEGHTDNVGNPASNKTLSEQRASSVKTALTNKGVETDRIKTIGYGQEKPIADNSTEEGKAKNRRVEIKKQQ